MKKEEEEEKKEEDFSYLWTCTFQKTMRLLTAQKVLLQPTTGANRILHLN